MKYTRSNRSAREEFCGFTLDANKTYRQINKEAEDRPNMQRRCERYTKGQLALRTQGPEILRCKTEAGTN